MHMHESYQSCAWDCRHNKFMHGNSRNLRQAASISMPYFGKVNLQVDGKMGKGKLLLELRMLKLADEQARLRAAVEKEQEDVQGLSERNYRKFVRNCLRQRIEAIKQVSRLPVALTRCIIATPVGGRPSSVP